MSVEPDREWWIDVALRDAETSVEFLGEVHGELAHLNLGERVTWARLVGLLRADHDQDLIAAAARRAAPGKARLMLVAALDG